MYHLNCYCLVSCHQFRIWAGLRHVFKVQTHRASCSLSPASPLQLASNTDPSGIPAMPSMAPVELDFLGLRPTAATAADHHHNGSTTGGTTTTSSSSSIRGMKTSAIASIGVHQLRRVIVGDEAPNKQQQAPMTVFYNGAVATFDGVSQDKAEAIMKMAMEVTTSNGGRRVIRGDTFAGHLTKDMPLTRTKSLQQFLQKRKERLSGLGPYQLGSGGTSRVGAAATNKSSFHVKEEAAA